MQTRYLAVFAAGLAAVAGYATTDLRANHAPVPSPPDFVFVGVETDATGTFGPEVVTGYWHVFDVTSHGTSDWINGHNGNTFKLWRRKDSSGGTTFVQAPIQSDQANPNNKRTTFRIRSLVSPAEYEWTNSFYVTEAGGIAQGDSTAPTASIAVTTPMPPVVLDERFGASAAAGFFNEAGAPRGVSNLPTLVAEATLPTIRMVIFGFNLAYPEYAWSETGPVPANYPSPKIRWNGELGHVSGEHRNVSLGNAVEFDVPVDLFLDHDGTGTAQIEVVQGTASVASAPYVLTLAPAPPGPRNVVAVAKTKKPQVRVTWDPPAGAVPEGYVIERRAVGGGSPQKGGPKADEAFLEIAELAATAESYIDKSVLADVVYDYRVRAKLVSGSVGSALNKAYPVGRVPAASLKPWEATWFFTYDGKPYRFEQPPALDLSQESSSWGHVESDEQSPHLTIGVPAPRRGEAVTLVTGRGSVERIRNDNLAPWALSLRETSPCLSQLEMLSSAPFDPDSFRTFKGKLVFAKSSAPVVEFEATVDRPNSPTLLGATVGTARDTAKPGQRIVVLFQCAALGPNPLYARRASVEVTVDNGLIVAANELDYFKAAGNPDGETRAFFDLGALGSDKKGKTQIATLSLLLEAGTDPGELSCTFRFVDDPNAPFADVQPLTFVQQFRRVEVKIE